MNARIYDPQIAKFGGTDPAMGAPVGGGDWNRYAYVAGNPLNHTDPSGLDDAGGDGASSDGSSFSFGGFLSQVSVFSCTGGRLNIMPPWL
jgi:uncharacterized protein RhaS with RHS repeats